MKYANTKIEWTKEWQDKKRRQDIQKKLRDFSNITLAGLELTIVVKRHLISNDMMGH